MNIKTNKLTLPSVSTIVGLFLTYVALLATPARALATSSIDVVSTTTTLNVYVFYSDTCPHCADEEKFLEKMQVKYPDVSIKRYEVTKNRDNLKLFIEVGTKLGDKSGRVPFLVIGQEYILGYLNDETHGAQIEQKIIDGLKNQPTDLVGEILNKKTINNQNPEPKPVNKEKFEMNFPLVGKVDINSLTLPIMTIALGLADGFNPCAMWALLFLISLLLGTKNRVKMWLLGGVFILTSGFVYFLFMAAWLNLFLIIGYAVAVRIGIGIIAAGFGGYYLWNYWKDYKNGCLVEGDEKRQATFQKLKKFTEHENIIWALLGMVVLAVAVNIVELLCSAARSRR